MKWKILISLALALGAVPLLGSSCILEDTEVEVPVRTSANMAFQARGSDDSDAGSATIDFGSEIAEAEAEIDVDELVRIVIENGYWRVTQNSGDPNLVISGAVTVTRVGTGQSADLISYTSIPIASVTGTFRQAPLNSAGVALLNAGLAEYVAWRQAGGVGSFPDLRFQFDWAGTSSPPPPPDVDFDWDGKITFSVVGKLVIEIPDPL